MDSQSFYIGFLATQIVHKNFLDSPLIYIDFPFSQLVYTDSQSSQHSNIDFQLFQTLFRDYVFQAHQTSQIVYSDSLSLYPSPSNVNSLASHLVCKDCQFFQSIVRDSIDSKVTKFRLPGHSPCLYRLPGLLTSPYRVSDLSACRYKLYCLMSCI